MMRGEFVSVSIGQWEAEYSKLPPARLGKNPLSPSEVYFRLQPIKEILGQDSHRDYYRLERAALVMETLSYFPLEVKRGGIALAVRMAKEDHKPTRIMGINLSSSIVALRDWLGIPTRTDRYVRSVLAEQNAYKTEGAASLIRRWQSEASQTPLEDWFRQIAQSASA